MTAAICACSLLQWWLWRLEISLRHMKQYVNSRGHLKNRMSVAAG